MMSAVSPRGELRVSPHHSVCGAEARSSSGCESYPATVALAGSNRSSRAEIAAEELFGVEGHFGGSGVDPPMQRSA